MEKTETWILGWACVLVHILGERPFWPSAFHVSVCASMSTTYIYDSNRLQDVLQIASSHVSLGKHNPSVFVLVDQQSQSREM